MTTPAPPSDSSSGSRRWLLIGGAVVLVAAVAGGLYWYLGHDVPEEASLEGALEAVETTTTEAATATTAPRAEDPAPAAGVDGTWTVDTSVGDFTFEEATATFVGFRIAEVLGTIGETEAVGRTPEVSGTMEIEGASITAVEIEANLDAIITNDSRRDSRAKGALNTSEFPTGAFLLTEPIDLGAVPEDGQPITATAIGQLVINGVSQPVEFAIEAQLTGDLIVVVGNTNVTFSDFDVEVPSAPIVVSVEDNGTVELQLWFSR